jgi:hypothetical protein
MTVSENVGGRIKEAVELLESLLRAFSELWSTPGVFGGTRRKRRRELPEIPENSR